MTIWQDVEKACEEFRTRLVELLGDIHGVHAVVGDAKDSILAHVPVEDSQESVQEPEAVEPEPEAPKAA